MPALAGIALGLGLLLVWLSAWEVPRRERPPSARALRAADRLAQAGLPGIDPRAVPAAGAAAGLVAGGVVAATTGALAVGLCAALGAAWAPHAYVSARARSRRGRLRGVWPDAVDLVRSGVRAGLSLPEALAELGERGPEELRPAFVEFGEDYRASGRFDASVEALQRRLADPVADRMLSAVRLARDVGGTDVGRVLDALSSHLRDEGRTRAELEARQSWTVNAARLAVAAPWVLLAMLASRPSNVEAFDSPGGVIVLAGGAAACVGAYRLMRYLGRLPVDERTHA
nr:type II secretion system F family protein [Demequina pelophila]